MAQQEINRQREKVKADRAELLRLYVGKANYPLLLRDELSIEEDTVDMLLSGGIPSDRLFPTDDPGMVYVAPGAILLHKKSTSEEPMSYVVHDVYQETEGELRRMVAYQALYGKKLKHVRPLSMFTTDRYAFIASGTAVRECTK